MSEAETTLPAENDTSVPAVGPGTSAENDEGVVIDISESPPHAASKQPEKRDHDAIFTNRAPETKDASEEAPKAEQEAPISAASEPPKKRQQGTKASSSSSSASAGSAAESSGSGGKDVDCEWFLFHGLSSSFGKGIVGTRLKHPGWVEVTDINTVQANDPIANCFKPNPKCLFGLVMKPCDDLRRKFFRWGQVRAYLVLKYVNLTEGEDSFDAHQPLVPADSWGYYWEECKTNAQNQVQRNFSSAARQVSFSRDQNYHPFVELTGKCDLWFTVWLRAQLAPCFFEIRLEDGSKNTLRVPFLSSAMAD